MYRTTLLLAAASLALPALGAPIFVVAPRFAATAVGNTDDDVEAGNLDIRAQQDIGSGQFSDFSGPIWITEIAQRAAPGTGPVDAAISNLDLYASTSPFFPSGAGLISSTFANNIGADNTLVFSGPFTLSSPGCAAGSTPCPFDMVLRFSSPFLYNRANGSLLLDFQITGLNGVSGSLDAVRFDPPGRSVATLVGPLNSATGEVFLEGDVLRLTVVPTPEPSSWVVMLCGLGVIAELARRRRS